ncbi:MAG: SusC/RagA family TonB-linked outer membrane protein [Tannerella sp.]|jgi:TonB-linked SusC/RagA family outer membrane protein|nr:SusC/RagA family TonB-linked outer membrane protein [Tannerella sp.]
MYEKGDLTLLYSLFKRIRLLAFLLLFTGFATGIYAQTVSVSGTVRDENGEALIGASVLVKGTQNGVITDADGNFQLSNVPSNATLVVSYISYQTLEVPVGGKTSLNITLEPDANALQEVIVTGITSVDKRLFTGAADHLNADEIQISGLPEISRSLEGRSAGVSVQNVSGAFGTAPRIKVRGATSIYGDSKPLWVVDGVIMEDVIEIDADNLTSGDAETLISSAIAGLNASDIESWDILKDGSATSIYGARAMAGVIVVTTKKGRPGQSRISYSGEFTSRMIPSYNDFNIMNSQDQMGIYREMYQKGWLNLASTLRDSETGVYGKMYELINTYDPATGQFALQNTEAARNAYLRQAEMRNTNWFEELFSREISQNHSVSISGGNDKSNYYGSMSALLDPGWMKASAVKRYTVNMNMNHKIYDNLSLNVIARGYYRNQGAPGTSSQNINAVFSEVGRDFELNPYTYAMRTSRTLDPNEFYTRDYAPFNIKHELENNYMDLNETNLNFQGELKWNPIRGLELKGMGAVKYTGSAMEHHITDYANQAQAFRAMGDATIMNNNPYLWVDPEVLDFMYPISILPQGGIYERTDHRMLSYDFRAQATYNAVIREDHLINLLGGMELNDTKRDRTWFRGWGRQYAMGDTPFYIYQAFKKWAQENEDYFEIRQTLQRNVAFFGAASYSYKGKYMINGTLRYDGSNRTGRARSSRWMPAWNISGAWNVHEEDFFQSLQPAFSYAKLRLSYSLTADKPPLSVTNSLPVIRSENVWRRTIDARETQLYLADIENSELTYEKKHELNIGVDLGFLDNRLNLVFEYYKRNNFDLVGNIAVMGIGGFVDKQANVASMKSSGVELTLTTRNIATPKFDWTTNFTFSKLRTEITDLESNARILDLITGDGFSLQGNPRRALYSIPFVGLDEDGIPDFIVNGNGDIGKYVYFQERDDIDFLKYEGSSEPTLSGGFGNQFKYRNVRLNVFFTYSFGNKLRLQPVFRGVYSDLNSMPKEFRNRWILPGDEQFTNIPVILSDRQYSEIPDMRAAYSAYNYSDVRIADGGFVRLKEISVSYDFPKKWIASLKFQNLALKLQATNLFLLYADPKLNGADPEFYQSGGVSYPVPRQFTATLQLTL